MGVSKSLEASKFIMDEFSVIHSRFESKENSLRMFETPRHTLNSQFPQLGHFRPFSLSNWIILSWKGSSLTNQNSRLICSFGFLCLREKNQSANSSENPPSMFEELKETRDEESCFDKTLQTQTFLCLFF